MPFEVVAKLRDEDTYAPATAGQRQDSTKPVFFSFLTHSKTLSSEMLDVLSAYHANMKAFYGLSFEAITFQRAAALIYPEKSRE